MKTRKFFQQLALGLATLGLCIPRVALAETVDRAPVINDIVLHQGGSLMGHVVTPENAAMENVQVALYSKDKHLATSRTDEKGRFMFAGLDNGVYEVAAPQGRGVFRAWQENIAPPSAEPSALIVNGSEVVRGQQPPARSLKIPLILAGLVATAIAVPVAIHNSKKPASGN